MGLAILRVPLHPPDPFLGLRLIREMAQVYTTTAPIAGLSSLSEG